MRACDANVSACAYAHAYVHMSGHFMCVCVCVSERKSACVRLTFGSSGVVQCEVADLFL